MTAGGMMVAPHMSLGEQARVPLKFDAKGNALYSPFFKEYVHRSFPDPKKIKAKLNANENPYGPSPKAVAALKGVAPKGNRYAWFELFELIDRIAIKEGLTAENILMGPGSSDLLEKTAMVLFLEGGNVVSADPSYMSLIRVAEAVGASWKGVPLKKDWSHDLAAMEEAIDSETKLVYICNPNNPTGSITDHRELLDFCSRVSEKVPVFVDEAYLDFLEDGMRKSMAPLVKEDKNVIVARTFSKIHGMAGLRVGYIAAHTKILDKMRSITRGGMGISYPSIFAAMASMEDATFQEKSRMLNAEARGHVYKTLEEMGYHYVPSSTSFIIFPLQMDGEAYLEKMYEQGVAVRSFEIMGNHWCRVSMGTLDEMKMFTQALQTVVG